MLFRSLPVGYMHAPRSIQMNSCLLFLILCFYFTHSIILIHFYESPFFQYFSLFYFPLFAHLFAMWQYLLLRRGYARAPTFRSEPTTRQVFASTRRDSFASAIPTCLHPLDVGLPKTFPCIVGGVETRATYDLIGKSWPGDRYMHGEPCNTVPLSSVLDHH